MVGRSQTVRVTAPSGQTKVVPMDATATARDAVRLAFSTAGN
jgi:hypothetical protein